MSYVIGVYQSRYYYWCIHEEFENCPDSFPIYSFYGTSDLRRYSKQRYRLINQCPDQYRVQDIGNGLEPEIRNAYQLIDINNQTNSTSIASWQETIPSKR